MRTILSLLNVLLTFSVMAFDTPAKYPGGMDSVRAFLTRHSRKIALEIPAGTSYQLEIRLTIAATGQVTKAAISKPFECSDCEKELEEAALAMMGWKPAKRAGTPIVSTVWTPFMVYGELSSKPKEEEEKLEFPPMTESGHFWVFDENDSLVLVPGESNVVEFPSERARFKEGNQGFDDYLYQMIDYPKVALEKGLSGICHLKFVVNADGTIGNIHVVKGVPNCPECTAVVVDALQKMPNWVPAYNDGQLVKSYVDLPFRFTLSENYQSPELGVPNGKGIYTLVDKPAQYPQGDSALAKFLQRPGIFEERRGTSRIRLTIDTTGKITEFVIAKDVRHCPSCDSEILKMLRQMPDWIPAEHDGKAVMSYVMVTVSF